MKIYENHSRFQLNIKIFLYGSLQYLQNITAWIFYKRKAIDADNVPVTQPYIKRQILSWDQLCMCKWPSDQPHFKVYNIQNFNKGSDFNLWTNITLNNIKHKYKIYGISPQFGAGQAIYYPSYHPTSFQQIWFPINDLNSIMFFPTLDKTFIIVTSILWNEKIKNQNL